LGEPTLVAFRWPASFLDELPIELFVGERPE
jgi:hypothetical protein